MIVRTTNGISCFRPLSGDLISQCVVRGWKHELAEVSVPFPGILFLNDSKWVFDESTTVWFPSPSRGSYFSIPERRFMKLAEFFESFRPLPGDLISQYCYVDTLTKEEICFRPLPGDLISQSIEELLMEKPSMFPSPSRGSYFSMNGSLTLESVNWSSFRPLPGDLISQ